MQINHGHRDQTFACRKLQFKLKYLSFPSANYWENKASCLAVIPGGNDRIHLAI